LAEQTDQDLIGACRAGDREAYAGLVRRYSRRVFAICYAAVGNSDDAEDLTQETFLRGFTQLHCLRKAGQFMPWLRMIARNLCLDFFRRRERGEVLVADPPERPDPRPSVSPEHLDLQEAIARLPEDLRLPLVFYYFDGRSTRNIAAALEMAEASVHTRLSRARKELRRLLSEKEGRK